MSKEERQAELKLWMEERHITNQSLADVLGVSRAFVWKMLSRDTMPAKRHKQMLLLGFPDELLPAPYQEPKPFFPSIMAEKKPALLNN